MADPSVSGPRVRTVPAGDTRVRLTCPECGFVAYENPKVVVGSVAVHDGRVLLCRRAIMPRAGCWTLPAGFLELGETAEEGALREAMEEAGARLVLEGILGVYSIAHIGQVQVIFRARLLNPLSIGPTEESSEVGLFGWEEIPWDYIAFPSVRWALGHWRESAGAASWPARGTPRPA
ncbi:NUDIX hydrolase [Elioraea sp.]|uniref:NUDIX hydrolase n=1 Tax=Elioraea sp. TaxID=2185103 RepID=UPI0021DDAAA6|nr:NUDIX hydrolase [Elioraea sp.]GIX10830.1 MAG: NUDIX hydrolase [Elioraea sp.]